MANKARDMKAVAAMLVCPHQWGEPRDVTLVDGAKRRNAVQWTCAVCGTHRLRFDDGTGQLVSGDGISDRPPAKGER